MPGLLLAVLALAGQLALGAVVLPDAPARSQAEALDALSVICVAEAPVQPQPERRHPHRPECALVALSAALALPAAMLLPAAPLPVPTVGVLLRQAVAVSARGPPSHASYLGFPRGPPVLA